MKVRNVVSAVIGLVLTVSVLNSVPSFATSLNVCTADSSQICAPISTLHYTTNGIASSIANGQASVNVASTIFQFSFSGTSSVSGKNLTVTFFDINGPMHLLPTIGDSFGSTGCEAAATAEKKCAIRADSQGNATFQIQILNPEVGDSFSYQTMGPAGFASGVVNIMYTTNGANTNPAESCPSDRSKVCPPISRANIKVGEQTIAKTFDGQGLGTSVIQTGNTITEVHFNSNSDYAYKWVFLKFFNASAGVTVALDSGDATSSRACDAQDAVHGGCRIKLDSQGNAQFIAVIAGGAIGKSVKYEFSGPNYDSKVVTINFASLSIFAAPVAPAKTVKVSASKNLITALITNASGLPVAMRLDNQPVFGVKPHANSVSYYFPVAAGKHILITTIKGIKKTSKVTVK